MSKGYPYPKEVIDFVRANAANYTSKELAQIVNQQFGTAFTASKMGDFKSTHKIKGKRTFTKEIKAYICENYPGSTPAKMAAQVNALFGTSYTRQQIRNFCNHRGIKTGLAQRKPQQFTRLFSEKVLTYIRENYVGVSPTEMMKRVNSKFGTAYTTAQIKNLYGNRKFDSGVHLVPSPRPPAHLGSIRKGKYGEPTVKVSMEGGTKRNPGTYRSKYLLAWEQAHGPIPEGNAIICLDGDRSNCDLSNLRMVTKQEAAFLFLHQSIESKAPQIMDARITLSKVKAAAKSAEKKLRSGGDKGE